MNTLLGKYRLDARLGGGGMAEVFLGSTVGAEGFSRRVAIKRVLPGFSENPQFSKMFIDEARISSRLVHPNIVSVVDFDRDAEGRLYLVMELVEGRDLDGLASTGPLPVPVVIFVISEVLRGLGHAHDLPVVEDHVMHGSQTIRSMRGIVHRDVSPHNVLLSWEGAVKVSDFGIAKARSATSATASEFIKGKPAYMSPEQANGEQLDGRSDLFAVGVMMWELLVGRRLFVGQDTRATLAAVLFGQIPRPRSLRNDVPKDLEKVAMKLLERELPSRYPTAEVAVKDLLDCAAAPRDGRELLKTILTERFPQQAPIRHSVLRSRGGSPVQGTPQPSYPPQPLPPHMQPTHQPPVPVHAQMTIADGNIGRPTPHGALPSLGQLRGANTATMQPQPHIGPAAVPRRPRGKGRLAIVIASSVAAAAVVFAIVASVSRGGPKSSIIAQGSGGSGAGSGSAAGLAAPPPPPPPPPATLDAAPAAPPPADAQVAKLVPPAIDAGPGEAKKDATVARPGEKKGMGRLLVKAFPILTVFVDTKKIHDTPVDMQLPAGKHKLRLVNSEGEDENLTVTIEENKPTTIDRN